IATISGLRNGGRPPAGAVNSRMALRSRESPNGLESRGSRRSDPAPSGGLTIGCAVRPAADAAAPPRALPGPFALLASRLSFGRSALTLARATDVGTASGRALLRPGCDGGTAGRDAGTLGGSILRPAIYGHLPGGAVEPRDPTWRLWIGQRERVA